MNTNTTHNAPAAAKVRRFDYTLDALDRAVVAQLGGTCRNLENGQSEIDADTAGHLADVCRCSAGAAGGFNGFIYYRETAEFTAKNRAAIVARLREQIDEGLFTDENGKARGVVGAVLSFNCFKGEDPAEIKAEAARLLDLAEAALSYFEHHYEFSEAEPVDVGAVRAVLTSEELCAESMVAEIGELVGEGAES